MNKINQLISKSINHVKLVLTSVDGKISILVPNPKLKKILYISIGSLFGFMLLIIILGILLSPLKNNNQPTTVINKPKIVSSTPEPQKELTEIQKDIFKLENEIKNLKFPDSNLNIPVLIEKITI